MSSKTERVVTTEPGNTHAHIVLVTREQADRLTINGKIRNQGYGNYATRLSRAELLEEADKFNDGKRCICPKGEPGAWGVCKHCGGE